MTFDGSWDGGSHLKWECIEIGGAVEIDVSYFILDFGLYFIELEFSEEGVGDFVELSYHGKIYYVTIRIEIVITAV